MCKEQIFIPKMIDFNDKKRRRKSKLRNILRTLLSKSTNMDRQWLVYEPIRNSNLKRTIFILTALIAFVLGLSVGVLIPFVILPKINLTLNETTSNILVYDYALDKISEDSRPSSNNSSNIHGVSSNSNNNSSSNSSYTHARLINLYVTNNTRQVNQYNVTKPFPSVSFVSDSATAPLSSAHHRVLPPSSGVSLISSLVSKGDSSTSATTGGLLDGIFWSEEVEARLPRGYDESDADRWRRFLRNAQVTKLEQGCGRMQNRLITFHDGSRACVRYRQNTDQIQGELFSFYLGRILNMNNLAPSSLSVVRTTSNLWRNVKAQILLAQWLEERPIIMTKYIDNLRPANIPKHFQSSSRRLHPIDLTGNEESLTELVQWSDLIVFDYLTANLDRIVNNLYNLQWNPGMMEAPAHNLAKNAGNDLLLFLDNESGLLHGYRLLDKYEAYHSVLLEALCIFRKPTIKILERLRDEKNVGTILNENLFDFNDREILPVLPEKSIKILNGRIKKVLDQVSWCQTQYTDSNNNVR